VATFAKGQCVEMIVTIPSRGEDSVLAGTRGIVQAIDPSRPDDAIYRVAFLENERLTGEGAWLPAIDLVPA
jgi:hypothetical protein